MADKDKDVAKKEDEKKNPTIIPNVPDWLIWTSVGVVVVAATATTVYLVQQKRNDELDKMRYGENRRRRSAFDFSAIRTRFSTYWGWTADSFTSVSSYISGLFKANKEANPLVSASEMQSRNEDSDSDCVDHEAEL